MSALLRTVYDQLPSTTVDTIASKVLSYARLFRQHPSLLAASVTLFYLILCRSLRYRCVDKLRDGKGYASQKSMHDMTNVDAQAIVKNMAELEFPTLFKASLNFALFKVGNDCEPLLRHNWLNDGHRHTVFQLYPACWLLHACFRHQKTPARDTRIRASSSENFSHTIHESSEQRTPSLG